MLKKTEEISKTENIDSGSAAASAVSNGRLFWEFLKIGTFTIGGGTAMIPQMQQIAVEDRKWLTEEDMLDCIALGQSLPGVIAINMATYIGFRKKGIPGAMAATLGVVLPAFLAIVIAMLFIDQIKDNLYVQGAFMGVKAAVCGLILVSAFRLIRKVNVFTIVMAVGALVTVGFLGVNAVLVIICSILIGIIYNSITMKRIADRGDDV